MSFERFAVLGAGAWGTALANAFARAGREVTLWARDEAAIATMRVRRESPRLAGYPLEAAVMPTGDLNAVREADAVLLAAPAQETRALAGRITDVLRPGTPVIAAAKGIERGTRCFMSDIIAQTLPQARVAILSGPGFAEDVARRLPTAVTLAAQDETFARMLAAACGSATFRPYHSDDVRGVEIGGAAKNVLAIAAGIVAGRRLGASAAAALTTRGFAELVRFGRVMGARAETLMGLSGLGDLLLTCSTAQSRNFSLGLALGEGRAAEPAAPGGKLAEGAFTASVLVELAKAHGIDMPISQAVAAVLEGGLSVDEAIDSLLTRPFRAEG
jgi:glycerol-3-phosphate dehydrogenase (NAD(P)+)